MSGKNMRTIRVLHFIEAAGGGVLSVVFDSIRVLQAEFPGRFEFTVMYSSRVETPDNIEDAHPDVGFIKIDVGRIFFSVNDLRVAFFVARESRNFDVLHCHSSRAGFIGRLSRLFGGSRRVAYSPHCYAFLSEEFSSFKRDCVFWVERVLAIVSGAVTIACGDSEMALAKKVGGSSILIRNGYFCPNMAIKVSGENPPIIVAVGRDSLQKDPDFFLEIASRFVSDEYRFSWVGALRDHPLSTGWVKRDVAERLIANSDIFLMTSRWEGLPIAGLEAMASGKPLVVRDVPGARDLVEHGGNGFLYHSIDEAVGYLQRLRDDPALRARLGRRSLELVQHRFSRRNYLALVDIYAPEFKK
ncbi:glycosyltransferase [Lysobacter sp. A289]